MWCLCFGDECGAGFPHLLIPVYMFRSFQNSTLLGIILGNASGAQEFTGELPLPLHIAYIIFLYVPCVLFSADRAGCVLYVHKHIYAVD